MIETSAADSRQPRRKGELLSEITHERRVPIPIHLCPSPVPDKAAREFSKEQLPRIYQAMAIVSKPGLSRFIMDLLFRLKPTPIPMRSFTDPAEALEWLQSLTSFNDTP
ncbi:MAG: STAS/SEC14 domain-containing protein [Saprospiraceae bacterium]|nr:STAS/SEC14 domain-containing protein [Saprospiraceae bacterium]